MNELEQLKHWVDTELKLVWYEHQQILDKIEEIEKEEFIQNRWEIFFNDRN